MLTVFMCLGWNGIEDNVTGRAALNNAIPFLNASVGTGGFTLEDLLLKRHSYGDFAVFWSKQLKTI